MTPRGVAVGVKDLGTVTDTYADADQAVYLNGGLGVALSVQKTGGEYSSGGPGLKKELERFRSLQPDWN